MRKFRKQTSESIVDSTLDSQTANTQTEPDKTAKKRRLPKRLTIGFVALIAIALIIAAAIILLNPFRTTKLHTNNYTYSFKFFKDAKLEEKKKGAYSQVLSSPSNGGVTLMAWPSASYHYPTCPSKFRTFSVKPNMSTNSVEVCKTPSKTTMYYTIVVEDSSTKDWHTIKLSSDLAGNHDPDIQKILNSLETRKD